MTMTTVLVLIDLQQDYFPGGAMALVGAEDAVTQARTLLQAFRTRALPVFHVQHIAKRPGATFFLPGTTGINFHAAVEPSAGEPVVMKHFPSSFRETTLLKNLRDVQASKLIFAGMMTHMCVDTPCVLLLTLVLSACLLKMAAPRKRCSSPGVR